MFVENAEQEYNALLDQWEDNENKTKLGFVAFCDHLKGLTETQLSFKGRPGVSYSVRATHPNQKERELYVLVDVIDDDPSDRWLSVCFYDDMITDPDEIGDWVPGGLMGSDARCFNLEEDDAELRDYIMARLSEAFNAAKA